MPAIVEALSSYPAAQFTVMGDTDPLLRREVLEGLPGERLIVPGDHILRTPGAVTDMVTSHHRFVSAFDDWLSTL